MAEERELNLGERMYGDIQNDHWTIDMYIVHISMFSENMKLFKQVYFIRV